MSQVWGKNQIVFTLRNFIVHLLIINEKKIHNIVSVGLETKLIAKMCKIAILGIENICFD